MDEFFRLMPSRVMSLRVATECSVCFMVRCGVAALVCGGGHSVCEDCLGAGGGGEVFCPKNGCQVKGT